LIFPEWIAHDDEIEGCVRLLVFGHGHHLDEVFVFKKHTSRTPLGEGKMMNNGSFKLDGITKILSSSLDDIDEGETYFKLFSVQLFTNL